MIHGTIDFDDDRQYSTLAAGGSVSPKPSGEKESVRGDFQKLATRVYLHAGDPARKAPILCLLDQAMVLFSQLSDLENGGLN